MRYNIRYTDDYALCVISKTDYTHEMVLTTISEFDIYDSIEKYDASYDIGYSLKIIAHRPLRENVPYLEDVDVLPYFDVEDDVEKLAESEIDRMVAMRIESPQRKKYEDIWIKGYNKCREKYRFTEEDMVRLFQWADSDERHIQGEKFNEFIQSLLSPKRPVAFECKTLNIKVLNYLEPKTITNSEWRREWVGKYIY